MANERKGTIEWRRGVAYARVWIDRPDGTKKRKRVNLKTRDPKTAERMLAKVMRLIETGQLTFDAGDVTGPRAEHFKPFAEQWIAKRKADQIAMAPDEQIMLKRHVYGVVVDGRTFAEMCLGDIRPRNVVAVLQASIDKGLSKGTVQHIKRMLSRLFTAAIGDDLLPLGANPVTAAKTPRIPEPQARRKQRAALTDDETAKLVTCPDVDLELRMMALVARVEGGMRTSEVNRWRWSDLDRVNFACCSIPRGKGAEVQALEIPEMLRPFLASWWIESGRPDDGPVFPVTKGPRKGEHRRTRGVSFAKRLRRELKKAGITRPELFAETGTTLPLDFHSFRRAFVTALAEADVNQQRAMALTGHSDPKVHHRYLLRTRAMRVIPPAALPRLGAEHEEAPAGDSPAEAPSQPLEI